MVESKKEDPPAPAPPPAVAILLVYILLGSLVSFFAGREPGTWPDENNMLRELAPAMIVVSGFLVSYSLWDVMAVGAAKARCQNGVLFSKSYKDLPEHLPEEVYLAQRVQTNQVEQMPVFLVGTFACAFFVDGMTAGVLAFFWAVLRRRYASVYRNAVGVPMKDIGLGTYTIPAYFISNAMLMAAAVHSVRCLLSSA